MNDQEQQTLNVVHLIEQLSETTAGLASVVGRYYSELPAEMPEELKQHLTLSFATVLHKAAVLGEGHEWSQ